MKKFVVIIACLTATLPVSSQILTVYIDTAKHFEHSSDIGTPTARRTGAITFLKTYRFFEEKIITFDLDRKVQIFEGVESPITIIHETDNLLDIEVNEDGYRCYVFFGGTIDGGLMYIHEFHDEHGKTKGFFSLNPKYTISEGQRFYINNQ